MNCEWCGDVGVVKSSGSYSGANLGQLAGVKFLI